MLLCILFTHSPTDGHLGCFQFLAIVNKAILNIHVSLCVDMFSFLLSKIPMASVYLTLKETAKLVIVPSNFPPAKCGISNHSTSSTTLGRVSVFYFEPFQWVYSTISMCYFNLQFPNEQ